jgi:hypothetical protein
MNGEDWKIKFKEGMREVYAGWKAMTQWNAPSILLTFLPPESEDKSTHSQQ